MGRGRLRERDDCMTRQTKKSESIEVRVSHDLKQAFMKKAADEGHSASEIMRNSIVSYLRGHPGIGQTSPWTHATAFAVAALVLLFAYSASTPATAGHGREFEAAKARLAFGRLDTAERNKLANQFGNQFATERMILTAPATPRMRHVAFATLDLNSDGRLSLTEFRQLMTVPSGDAGRKLFDSLDGNHDGSLSEQEFDL
jgi:hypothetical protein